MDKKQMDKKQMDKKQKDKKQKDKKKKDKKQKKDFKEELKKLLELKKLIEKLQINKTKGELNKEKFAFNKYGGGEGAPIQRGVYLQSTIPQGNPFVQSGFLQETKDVSGKKLILLLSEQERRLRDFVKEKMKNNQPLNLTERNVADWINAVDSVDYDYEPSVVESVFLSIPSTEDEQ